MRKKRVIILGSTGSIGTQALDVIRARPDEFEVVGLSANQNGALLKKQAEEFEVERTVLAEGKIDPLECLVKEVEAECVLVAVSGTAGLWPTLVAIRSGKNIALANKETLVMAGELVMAEVAEHGVQMIPVDSEHSAIFQILQTVDAQEVEKIILTCSGGAFSGKTRAELREATPEDALKHPKWSMGKKITIDSATLINKGFEVIEAHHFFGFSYDQIEVRIHPECMIHGIVELKNGEVWVNVSKPDMRIPIRYALNYPDQKPEVMRAKWITKGGEKGQQGDWIELGNGTQFQLTQPDHETFEGLKLGVEAGRRGGFAPAILNVANDRAVQDFLNGKIKFLEIYKRIKHFKRQEKRNEKLNLVKLETLLRDSRPSLFKTFP